MGGLGVAGLAAAGGSAFGQAVEPGCSQASTGQPMSDPTTKYPRPPFPVQPQPWPGLASKMTPKLDHGETSYKGSGRLMGRKALITGGDSGMGRAAAIAYAREGADVAINYLPVEEPDAKEVVALIQQADANASRFQAICAKRRSAEAGGAGHRGPWRAGYPCVQCGPAAICPGSYEPDDGDV